MPEPETTPPACVPISTDNPEVQVWPLDRVFREVAVGSGDWTWDEEWADLDRRHKDTGYLDKLEQQIRENGITMPVLIGSDGRLWDGHHRLRIAVKLGIGYVPVEVVAPPTGPGPGGGLTADEALDAVAFVGEMCDIADQRDTPISTADVRLWLKGPRPGHRVSFPPQPTPAVPMPDQRVACGCAGEASTTEYDGVATPGCDCGHDGMGAHWHANDCEWKSGAAMLARIRDAWLAANNLVYRMVELDLDGARIQRILGGKQPPSSLDLAHLSIACQVSVDWLITGKEPRHIGPITADRHEPAPAVPVPGLRDQIAGAVQPLLMDNLPKPIAAVRAEEIADVVLFVLQQNRAELASLAVNAMNALIDEKRHYEIACGEIARLKAEQERYEDDVVGRFNQQATVDRRRAETAEATVERVRDALAQCHGWGETGDAYYAAIRTALTPPVPADQPEGGAG